MRPLRRTSITGILSQALILVTLIPFLPIAWLIWHDYGKEAARIEGEIQATNRQVADLAASVLDGLVRQAADRALVASGGKVQGTNGPLPPDLAGVRWELVAKTGQVVASSVSPGRVGHGCGYMATWSTTMGGGSLRFSPVDRWIDGFPATSVMPFRIAPDRFLVAVLDPDALQALLSRSPATVDRHVYVVDTAGRALVHPSRDVMARNDDLSANPPVSLFMRGGKGELRYVSTISGKQRLGVVRRLREAGFGVVVSADVAGRLVDLYARTAALAGSIAFALLAALTILVWTSRRLTSPVLAIRDGLAASGGPSHAPLVVPPAARTVREYDDLVRGFDELSERFAATERELVVAEKAMLLGQLATGVAHEIGTPLNVMTGNAQYLLKRTADDDASRGPLQLIVRQGERITAMIRRLLDFARPAEPRLVPVDLAAVVHQTLDVLPSLYRGVETRLDLSPSVPPVLGDPKLLEHALMNLVVNACQAMPDGGTLSIAIGTDAAEGGEGGAGAGEVVLRVADTGTGISAENLSKVFQPFFTTKPQGQGNGLGLAIVERIIRQHGGTIEVESREGVGTVFTVKLQAAETLAERREGAGRRG